MAPTTARPEDVELMRTANGGTPNIRESKFLSCSTLCFLGENTEPP